MPTARFTAHTGLVPAVSLPGRGTTLTGRGAPAVIARLPGGPGVYRFRDARGTVLYVGRATALRPRVALVLVGPGPARPSGPDGGPGDPGRGGQLRLAARGRLAGTQRQPDAVARVRGELEQLRRRAADSLAFEFAGRIHGEISALDWVIGPQRVTTMDAGDFDVYGWSGGVLVRFGVRGGRLCHWSQRACTQSRAASRLAVTPAGWAGFAGRNAELAAALGGAGG